MIMMVGPGHGGPALVAQTYLESRWEEVYPDSGVVQDVAGMRKLFRQFSAPGGIPSHCEQNTRTQPPRNEISYASLLFLCFFF